MRFSMLGPVSIVAGEDRHPVRRAQTRGVLALLALNVGRPLPRPAVTEALWSGLPPPSASSQVQGSVYAIRRQLSALGLPETIESGPFGYRLTADPDQVDALRFEHMTNRAAAVAGSDPVAAAAAVRAALELWQGQPLADAAGAFVEAARTRLVDRRLAAMEQLAQLDLDLGRHSTVAAELATVVAAHPLRETLRAHYMVALYRCGRQVEALRTFREYRHLLADQEGLDPGSELVELERAILRGDASLNTPAESLRSATAALLDSNELTARTFDPTERPSRPCLLPADIADLTGRDADIHLLTQMLSSAADPPSVPVVVVTGRAGVGKSTLAIRVAHLMRGDFCDGQLFVDLGGATSPQVKAEVALARFLRALGIDGMAIPEDVDERAELYRGLLAERRLLVIIDNASSAAQVRPLMPGGAGCAVLVTSRRPLTGLAGAAHLEVETLSAAGAIEMLSRIVGSARVAAEPVAARSLVDLCGHLPLAIRIAGGRLTGRPGRPLEWLVERLAGHRRLDELALDDLEVRTSLSMSYRGLPPDAQRLLRALGLLDAPSYAAWLAAALVDEPVETAGQLLESLVDERLADVVDTSGGPRYQLHDLVRLYARERAMAEDADSVRRAALDRAVSACLLLVELAVSSLPFGGFGLVHSDATRYPVAATVRAAVTANPFGWLDAEASTLLDAVDQAATAGFTAHAWDLAGTLQVYLRLRGRFDEFRHTHEVAFDLARRSGDGRGQATLLRNLGLLESAYDRISEVYERYTEASAAFVLVGDRVESAATDAVRAWVLGIMGRLREATRLLLGALPVLHASGSLRHESYALTTRAVLLFRQGFYDRAERCLTRALDRARHVGFSEGEAHILAWLGRIHLRRGEATQAVQRLQAAVDLLRSVEFDTGTAGILPFLAEAHAARGDWAAADRALHECLAWCQSVGVVRAEATALRVRGQLRFANAQPAAAVADLTRAVELCRTIEAPWDLAQILDKLKDAQRAAGDPGMHATARELADLIRSLGSSAGHLSLTPPHARNGGLPKTTDRQSGRQADTVADRGPVRLRRAEVAAQ